MSWSGAYSRDTLSIGIIRDQLTQKHSTLKYFEEHLKTISHWCWFHIIIHSIPIIVLNWSLLIDEIIHTIRLWIWKEESLCSLKKTCILYMYVCGYVCNIQFWDAPYFKMANFNMIKRRSRVYRDQTWTLKEWGSWAKSLRLWAKGWVWA